MMRSFFNNEKEEAENIFKNGFTNHEFNGYEAYLIAKYYRYVLNYKDQKVKSSLVSFCQKEDRLFNYVINRKTILEIVKNSQSEWKNKTNKIIITKNELENIFKLKNFNYQKILLAFLVFAKRDNGYVYRDRWSDIKKLSNIRITDREIYLILHKAYLLGLVRDSNQNHFINFIENQEDGEIVFSSDRDVFRLSEIYKKYLGGEIGYCSSCGFQFVKKGRGHRYCDDCSEKREKNNLKNRVKKHRGKES